MFLSKIYFWYLWYIGFSCNPKRVGRKPSIYLRWKIVNKLQTVLMVPILWEGNQQSWPQKVGSQIKGSWFFWFSNFVGGFSWFASPLAWCLDATMIYAAVLCIIYAYTCIHVISIFLHAYVQTCLFAGGWQKKNRIEERDWSGTYFLKGSHGSQDFVVRNDSPCGSTIGGVWRGWYCSTMKGIRFFEDLGFVHIFRKLGMEMLKLMMCFKHNPPKKTMCSKHNPNNQIFGITGQPGKSLSADASKSQDFHQCFFPRRPNHLLSHWCSDAWWKEWITRTFSTLKRTFWWIPWQLASIGKEFWK